MSQTDHSTPQYPQTGLPLPTKVQQKNSFFHQPDAIAQWLNELPLVNPLESAKLLFKTLFEMNRVELNIHIRMTVLEMLHHPVETVIASLKNHFTANAFPLSEKNRKIALLSRELLKEIAIGYKICIADHIHKGKQNEKEENSHIIAVHRAMSYLSLVLFKSSMIYEPYPSHVWHELHLLFTYSSVNKIERVLISHEKMENASKSSIYQVYKKALLLSAASPYQLRQRDIINLYQLLDTFTDFASLTLMKTENSMDNLGFLVKLNADLAPVHLSTLPPQRSKKILILDTRKLLLKLQDPNFEFPKKTQLNTTLKQLLLKNWGIAPQRNYVRTRLNFDLNIAIGINHIHELIESEKNTLTRKNIYLGKDESSLKPEDNLQRSSMFIIEDEDEKQTDALTLDNFNTIEPNHGTFLSSQKIAPNMTVDADELNHKKEKTSISIEPTHECKTINESSGGYCIEWPNKSIPGIKVGELIGIQSTSSAVDFALASTRWLKNIPNQSLMVGIEILTHSCQAVKIRPDKMIPKHKNIIFYPALMITQTIEKSLGLITPSDQFKEGENIILQDNNGQEMTYKLLKLVESSGLFSLYNLE